MAYSTDVALAEEIAREAHFGAVDKAGKPYIEHPERVAGRLDDPRLKVIAWLHDVVEDSYISLELIWDRFGEDTANAVDALTHRKGEMWADYLTRVKGNEFAKAVKISDLIDNSNLSRLSKIGPRDVARQAKYNRALYYLMDADGE